MPREFPFTTQPDDQEGGISYSVGFELSRFTGTTLVVGDTVFLSDEGVEVLASTDGSYYSVNAYSFIDAQRDEIGGMYGRDDAGQNVVGFRVVDEAEKGDDTLLQLASTCQTGSEANISITASQDGGDYATITLVQNDSDSQIMLLADEFVRIGRKINLLGASNELCDMYITGTYFVLKYNTGAQYYYKYIDLNDTSPTWSHSTSEP